MPRPLYITAVRTFYPYLSGNAFFGLDVALLALSLGALVLVLQLGSFHAYLVTHGLTTYDYIMKRAREANAAPSPPSPPAAPVSGSGSAPRSATRRQQQQQLGTPRGVGSAASHSAAMSAPQDIAANGGSAIPSPDAAPLSDVAGGRQATGGATSAAGEDDVDVSDADGVAGHARRVRTVSVTAETAAGAVEEAMVVASRRKHSITAAPGDV